MQRVLLEAAGRPGCVGAAVDVHQHRQARFIVERWRADRDAEAVLAGILDKGPVPSCVGLYAGGRLLAGVQHPGPWPARSRRFPATLSARCGSVGDAVEDGAAVRHGQPGDFTVGYRNLLRDGARQVQHEQNSQQGLVRTKRHYSVSQVFLK